MGGGPERDVDLFDVRPSVRVAGLPALLLPGQHGGAERGDVEAVDLGQVLLELELCVGGRERERAVVGVEVEGERQKARERV